MFSLQTQWVSSLWSWVMPCRNKAKILPTLHHKKKNQTTWSGFERYNMPHQKQQQNLLKKSIVICKENTKLLRKYILANPFFWQRHQRSFGFKFILHPFIPLQSIAKPVRRQQLSFKCPYDVMFILLASDFLGAIVWLSLLLCFFSWSLHFSGGLLM